MWISADDGFGPMFKMLHGALLPAGAESFPIEVNSPCTGANSPCSPSATDASQLAEDELLVCPGSDSSNFLQALTPAIRHIHN